MLRFLLIVLLELLSTTQSLHLVQDWAVYTFYEIIKKRNIVQQRSSHCFQAGTVAHGKRYVDPGWCQSPQYKILSILQLTSGLCITLFCMQNALIKYTAYHLSYKTESATDRTLTLDCIFCDKIGYFAPLQILVMLPSQTNPYIV